MATTTDWSFTNTEHGLLVAFGEFLQQHGLLEQLMQVPIQQKPVTLAPQTKVGAGVAGAIGFIAGPIGGLFCGVMTRLFFLPLGSERPYHLVTGIAGGLYGTLALVVGVRLISTSGYAPPIETMRETIVLYGQPGAAMPTAAMLGLTEKDVIDVITYAATLPLAESQALPTTGGAWTGIPLIATGLLGLLFVAGAIWLRRRAI